MKEKKNKSPKDIEKRKVKTKKIIFFILHGISYILSLMFIGSLLIGGCSKKANTYKSASAAYSSEKLLEVDSIDLSNINGYKYQLMLDNPDYNLPSKSLWSNYLGDLWSIEINYNYLPSKSGDNALVKFFVSDHQISIGGVKLGDGSVLPSRYNINLFTMDENTGRYYEDYIIEDLDNNVHITNVDSAYVLSEFFDGIISILNYSSINLTPLKTSVTNDMALKYVVFYFSQHSIIGANASINTNWSWYLSLVGGSVEGNVNLHSLTNSVLGVKSFYVGDFSYGASLYDKIEIEYKTFDREHKYYYGRFNAITTGWYEGSAWKPYALYLNRVSFVNSITENSLDIIYATFTSHEDSLLLSGMKVVPSSTSYIHYRNLAIYNSSNFNVVFAPDNGGNSYRAYRAINLRNFIFKVYNYSVDTNPTTEESLINVFDLISRAFNGLGGILSIAILPSLTIGTLFAIPIVMVFIIFIIKLFKR